MGVASSGKDEIGTSVALLSAMTANENKKAFVALFKNKREQNGEIDEQCSCSRHIGGHAE